MLHAAAVSQNMHTYILLRTCRSEETGLYSDIIYALLYGAKSAIYYPASTHLVLCNEIQIWNSPVDVYVDIAQ